MTPDVKWGRPCPLTHARGDLRVAELDLQRARRQVEADEIAVAHRGDGSTGHRFRCDVPGHQAVRRAREASVRQTSATESPSPAPTIAPVTPSISRMPGPPFDPLLRMTTTSRLDSPTCETPRTRPLRQALRATGPRNVRSRVPGDLHDAALGRQVAPEDHQAARGLERRGQNFTTALTRRLDSPRRRLLSRIVRPADRHFVAVQRANRLQPGWRPRGSARRVRIDVTASHLQPPQIGEDGVRAPGAIETLRARPATALRLAGDRAIRWSTALVEPPVVATAAMAFSSESCVMIGCIVAARPFNVHDQRKPTRSATLFAAGVHRGRIATSIGVPNSRSRHPVFAVN